MLMVVIANVVLFSAFDFHDRQIVTPLNQTLHYLNIGFTMIYVLEAVFTIVATGIIDHHTSYLKSNRNWFNLTIILFGYFALYLSI